MKGDKCIFMIELSPQQTQQKINCEQVYTAYRAAQQDYSARFKGSMAWKKVNGKSYLYRKTKKIWISLGPETDETRAIYQSFTDGREQAKQRLETLKSRLAEMAPVNVALRLGRVPLLAARILRRLDAEHILGKGLCVVGTNALYVYEAMAGIHLDGSQLATLDIDLLFDARQSLKIASSALNEAGLLGLLQSVDHSIQPVGANSFRAANRDGYLIDLITPLTRFAASSGTPPRVSDHAADLLPVEIAGLKWIESSPMVEHIVIDEKGFPLNMVVPDPRVFAMHKAWVAQRDDRTPEKSRRDRWQADTVAALVVKYLPHLDFTGTDLMALPAPVRETGIMLQDEARQKKSLGFWDY